jgi:hypothetical protein
MWLLNAGLPIIRAISSETLFLSRIRPDSSSKLIKNLSRE